MWNNIYACSTILPKLKSSHYSALICILLEDSSELMNLAISLLLWQNMWLEPTWRRNQYSSAYLFIQSSYSNLLEKTETLFRLCSSRYPRFLTPWDTSSYFMKGSQEFLITKAVADRGPAITGNFLASRPDMCFPEGTSSCFCLCWRKTLSPSQCVLSRNQAHTSPLCLKTISLLEQ